MNDALGNFFFQNPSTPLRHLYISSLFGFHKKISITLLRCKNNTSNAAQRKNTRSLATRIPKIVSESCGE